MHLGALEPGRFMSPDNGATVIYPRAVVDNEARDVFMFERQQGDRVVTTLAQRAERTVDPSTG